MRVSKNWSDVSSAVARLSPVTRNAKKTHQKTGINLRRMRGWVLSENAGCGTGFHPVQGPRPGEMAGLEAYFTIASIRMGWKPMPLIATAKVLRQILVVTPAYSPRLPKASAR